MLPDYVEVHRRAWTALHVLPEAERASVEDLGADLRTGSKLEGWSVQGGARYTFAPM